MFVDLITVIIAFVIVYALVPAMRWIALRTGFVDMPTERKAHKHPLPMLGGAAMIIGFIVATTLVRHNVMHPSMRADNTFIGLLIGAFLMFVIGMVDDFAKTRKKDFPAWPKFLVQIIAAAILVLAGAGIKGIEDPIHNDYFIAFTPWISAVLTIVWVVGIVNVFNFLDGLDGLAGGIAAMSAMTLLVISTMKGDISSAISAAALIGGCLAFLRFNFYPARIIMGDAGSTFIGYVLAAVSVMGAFKSATAISIFVPVLALGVPIFDAIYVVMRRMIEGRPVYKADRTHSHYRLMASGLTQVQTVSVMYLVALGFSVVAIAIAFINR